MTFFIENLDDFTTLEAFAFIFNLLPKYIDLSLENMSIKSFIFSIAAFSCYMRFIVFFGSDIHWDLDRTWDIDVLFYYKKKGWPRMNLLETNLYYKLYIYHGLNF